MQIQQCSAAQHKDMNVVRILTLESVIRLQNTHRLRRQTAMSHPRDKPSRCAVCKGRLSQCQHTPKDRDRVRDRDRDRDRGRGRGRDRKARTASGGGIGTVGRVLAGAGTHPFGHHAGLVAAVIFSVHLRGAVEHAEPSRIVPARAQECQQSQ